MIRLLLEKGADVNAQGGEYGNALQAAKDGNHNKIISLLEAAGAVEDPTNNGIAASLPSASSTDISDPDS